MLSTDDTALRVLRALHSAGVSIAIDDFGTGYSSLNYLKQFQAEKLKIDSTFVRDLTKNSETAKILAAIVTMAQCLGMKTTAEGIETERELELLKRLGFDLAQGYLFCRPLSEDALKAHFQQKQKPRAACAIDGIQESRLDRPSLTAVPGVL